MANDDVVARGSLLLSTTIDSTALAASAQRSADMVAQAMDKSLTNTVGKITNTINSGLNSALNGTVQVLKTVGAVGTTAIAGLLGESIKLGVSLNEAQAKFLNFATALTGSQKQANKFLDSLKQAASTSPFDLNAFTQAGQQLASFGISANKIPGVLSGISAAVASVGGSASSFDSLANAIGRASIQGKLGSRVLFQFSQNGIDAAKVIGDALGKTAEEAKRQLETGVISFNQALDALSTGLQTKFGATAKLFTTTLPGSIQVFRKSLADLGAELTKSFVSPTGGGAAVTLFNDLGKAIDHLKDVVTPVTDIIGKFATQISAAADKALGFFNKLSTGGINAFISKFSGLGPVLVGVAGAFSGLTSTFLRQIPVIGGLIPALDPVTAAFAGFLLSIPAVREQFVRIAETLRSELAPTLQAAIPLLKNLEAAVAKLAVPIGDALVGSIKILAPALTEVITLLDTLITAVTPVVNAFLKFGPVKDILEVLIVRFALLKVASLGVFQGLIGAASTGISALVGVGTSVGGLINRFRDLPAEAEASLGQVAVSIDQLSAAAEAADIPLTAMAVQFQEAGASAVASATEISGASAVMAAAKTAALGLGQSLLGLANPVNIAIAAFLIYSKTVQDAKAKTDKLFAAATQGIDTSSFDGLNQALTVANTQLSNAKKHVDDLKGGLHGTLVNLFPNVDPAATLRQVAAEKAYQEALKNRDAILKNTATAQDILTKAEAQTGDSQSQLLDLLKSNGIDIFKVDPASEDNFVKKLVDLAKKAGSQAGQDGGAAFSQNFIDATQALTDGLQKSVSDATSALDSLFSAADSVTSANDALAAANTRAGDTTKQLTKLEQERAKAAADTGSRVRELQAAEDALARTRLSLQQNDEERLATLKDIAKLETPATADELAAAERNLTRAKLALLDAQKTQNELDQQAAAIPSVNLAGLSLDQAKAKLANVRATLAAQQQGNAATTQAGKSQQDIDEEKLKKTLDIADATQGVKDAQKTITDLQQKVVDNGPQIQADQEKLVELDLSRRELLRSQADELDKQKDLLAGNTQQQIKVRDLDAQIDTLRKQQTQDTKDVAKAQRDLTIATDQEALAVAKSKNDQEAILAATIKLNGDKAAGLANDKLVTGELQRQLQILQQQAALLTQQKLQTALSGVGQSLDDITAFIKDFGSFNTVANALPKESQVATEINALQQLTQFFPQLTAAVIGSISNQLVSAAPGTDLRALVIQLLRAAGVNVSNLPAFAKGGVQDFGTESVARLHGLEAVLPLSRPLDLANVLSLPQVTAPVLKALSTIDLSRAVKPGPLSVAPTAAKLSFGAQHFQADQDKRREMEDQAEMIARALAKELVAAGVDKGGIAEGAVNVTIQQTAPNQAISEKEIERIMTKVLRGI